VTNNKQVPFDIKRIYYLYDIPGGLSRGAHAHKDLKQLVVALSGSFDITLDDGQVKRTFQLSRPNMGLLIPAGLWRELYNFSSGSICMVLASEIYNEQDYLRDYNEFSTWKLLK
jgi:dTDP-4-dehydrorhamnose 3,5-epimerase-like enzyme